MIKAFLKNKTFQSFGLYTLSNVINSGIPFLLLPLLTNYLAPEEYGKLTNFNSLLTLLIPITSINFMTALQVVYVKDKAIFPSYVSTGMLTMLIMSTLVSVLLFIFSDSISALIQVPKSFVIFTGIYCFYQNVFEVILSIWRMDDRVKAYGIFRIGRTVLELSITLILVIGYRMDFEGSINGLNYSYGLFSLISIFILWKDGLITKNLNKKHVEHIFRYGVPLIPHVLSSVVILYTDKILLTKFHGLSSNGIYSVGFMVGQVIGLFQNSFNLVWVPYAYKRLKNGEHKDKVALIKWTYIYFIGILVLVLLFYLFTPVIFYFLGKSYQVGISMVLWIALGFAFNGMYKMVSVYFFYFEKTIFIAIVSTFSAVVNILLALYLIPKFSFFGAAISTMTAFLSQFLFTWAYTYKVYKMPWFNVKKWKN